MNKLSTYERKIKRQYLTLLIPAFILFTIGIIIPIIMCIYYSLFDWDGFSPTMNFLGIKNYLESFKDNQVQDSWKFTILFSIINSLTADVSALLLAVLLDSKIKLKSFQRTIVFIPCLFSAIVTGFVWKKMYSTILPAVVGALGGSINLKLFGSQDTVLIGLTIANCWQFTGLWMMIYLASLQSVSQDYYEAATVDGANAVQRFFHVTIPMIMPAIITCTVGLTTGALRTYDILVTSTEGGPGKASTTIVYYMFAYIFKQKRFGYGCALSVLLILLLLLVAIVEMAFFRKKEVQM